MYDKILDVGKRRGIVYPSFEIYGGVSGFIDYGPVGSQIKNNVENTLRKHYVVGMGCFEVQCPTVSPEDVWIASGHVGGFKDLMVECLKCKEGYRADKLLEEVDVAAEGKPADEVKSLLDEKGIKCKKCGGDFGEPFGFDLMFETSCGAGSKKKVSYLRPETAQTTYLAFKRYFEYARRRLPFGVIQIGHSFRNEISPRQGMLRLREFNQAEVQFFIDPELKNETSDEELPDDKLVIRDKDDKVHEISIRQAHIDGIIRSGYIAMHLGKAIDVFRDMGVDGSRLKLRQHRMDELAFYSSDTWDVEYESEAFGTIELVGIADRGDYDLGQHMKHSKQDMNVSFEGKKFIPHVIEVAYGVDRPIYCLLESCLIEEDDRTYFSFPKNISPFVCGVFSLSKKDGLKEKADKVFDMLSSAGIHCFVDHAGSIGKRYARSDEIGVYYCITVDYDTMEDDTVTVRVRDSKQQERVNIGDLSEYLMR